MHDRRHLRSLLVLSNFLLVLAPHVALADRKLERQPEPQVAPAPNAHHAPGKVRPQPASSPSPRPRTTSQAASDDDDGGQVAGEVASACCAGMIGAMAEPSTPEDVELPYVEEPEEDPSIALGAGGAQPTPNGGTGARSDAPFDRRAAETELAAANTRALDKCGPSDLDSVGVRVTFHPSGEPFDLTFTPTGFTNTDHGRCVEGEVLGARIAPFAGVPTAVDKTLTFE